MYKILAVDDEPAIRNTLKKLLNPPGGQYGLIGNAQNGAEGLALAKKLKPDIIIVDIRMPKMDGLEMIKRLNDTGSRSVIIILTAYDEFEYAKRALKLSAFDYILKPIKKEELVETVLNAINYIKKDNNKSVDDKNGVSYQDILLKKMIEPEGYTRIAQDVKSLLCIRGDMRLTAVLFHIPDIANRAGAVRTWLDIVTNEDAPFGAFPFLDEDKRPMILIAADKSVDTGVLHGYIKRIQDKFFVRERFALPAGIGCEYPPDSANKSYSEADMALDYRFVLNGGIIPYDLCAYAAKAYPADIENRIANAVRLGDSAAALSARDDMFDFFLQKGHNPVILKQYCTRFGLHVLNCLQRAAVEDYMHIDDVKYFYNMGCYETVMDYIKWIGGIFEKAVLYIEAAKGYNQKNAIREKIERYMAAHFHTDISLQDIADHIGVTPAYFSMLFKKNFDMNFVEYLTWIRLEKAKGLLLDTGLNIDDIAHESGFNDSKYFFKVFKRHEGITPTEYRKVHISE
jgi:two-component system response regulator YesN